MSYFVGFIVVCVLPALIVVWIVRALILGGRSDKTASWPVAEGTVQFVDTVLVHAVVGYSLVDTGDFSYAVNDKYYSGKLMFSRRSSTEGRPPRALINQKIQVRYHPQKPEKYSVPRQEINGFLLRPYGALAS